MIAEQDCSEAYWENYEPDSEDFAWMIAQEKELKSLRSGYHEADKELRNSDRHTDRQLRGLHKEKECIKRHLAWTHHFDVIDDSFEVEIADDVYHTVPWHYDDEQLSDEALRDPTRKDKRRARKEQRKAARYLERIRLQQGRNPEKESVVRKTGALVPTVAA